MRVTSLEQIKKDLKAKCDQLANDLAKEKEKVAESAKQAEKYKQLLKLQEQKQIKQEEASVTLSATKPKIEEEKQKVKVKSAENIGEHISGRDITKTFSKLLCNILVTIKKSLPFYISIYKEEIGNSEAGLGIVRVGELLYPSLPDIMPEIVDVIHASQGAMNLDQFFSTLEVAWETINFAFETADASRIFEIQCKKN